MTRSLLLSNSCIAGKKGIISSTGLRLVVHATNFSFTMYPRLIVTVVFNSSFTSNHSNAKSITSMESF